MPLTHYEHPNHKVIVAHGGVDNDVSNIVNQLRIIRRENAVDTATLIIPDEFYYYLNDIIDQNDILKIYLNYKEIEDPLTFNSLRFYGCIDEISQQESDSGILLQVRAKAKNAEGLLNMLCGQQYGIQSSNYSLDATSEIVTDIITNWVNKLLNTATDSGYVLDTTYIEAVVAVINYLYNAFKPAKNSLDDLSDIITAINEESSQAGIHYIVRDIEFGGSTTSYLCLATVGNHPSVPINVASKWPTWFNVDQANSTIEVKKDMILQNFMRQRAEANYVLYHGALRIPAGEYWTEKDVGGLYGSNLWTKSGVGVTLTDDNFPTHRKMGFWSIKASGNTLLAVNDWIQVPKVSQHWNIANWGGIYNKPRLNFLMRWELAMTQINLRLYSGADYWETPLWTWSTTGTWKQFNLPIGPYWDSQVDDSSITWTASGTPLWTDVDYIQIRLQTTPAMNGEVWFDDLNFSGHILRGAKKAGATKYIMKQINDDLAKDDVGKAGTPGTTDTGTIARLAKAELLRSASTPLTGKFKIPCQPNILAGQLCHIHTAKKSDGTFRTNLDMRILEHEINLVGGTNGEFSSLLTVTDDLTNSRPMNPMTAYNLLQKVVSPEFQNRQTTSQKARDIDITQIILEETYTF